jgi:tetratricopeptide (TPR) repeat protein
MLGERGTMGDVPESVQGVIAARLDALPRAEKDLLQDAAVHGKVFWVGALPPDAEGRLRALERKDFVRRERQSAVAGDTQYSFHHALLRDVAYGQIPRRARADKHRRAAEWIERLGRTEDQAELLAHHYKQALELERAAGGDDDPALLERTRAALRAAGERALALSAYAQAAEFFSDALELTPTDDPERPRLLLLRGRAVGPMDIEKVGFALLTEAMEGFRAAGDAEGLAEAATLASRAAWFAGDRAVTDEHTAIALNAVAHLPSSRARAEALANQSGFLMLAGEYEESIRVVSEALPLVEALGMEQERARLHIIRGTAMHGMGDLAGVEEIREGIVIAEAAASLDMVTVGYANLTSSFHGLARLDDARAAWAQERDLGERAGLGRFIRDANASRAGWEYLDGQWDDAMVRLNGLIADADAGKTHFTDASMFSLRAWISLARGDVEGAERDSARAVEIARESDTQAQAAAFTIRPAIALAIGARDEADELASELAAIGPVVLSALGWPFPTLTDVAFVFRDLGREEELRTAILDPTPQQSAWLPAAHAIADGNLALAADRIDEIGHTAAAAYARLRSGTDPNARAALAFYRGVGATRFVREGEAVLGATA